MSCDLHICARCAAEDTTCCQQCEIYVTPGDVERIAQHTGKDDFTEFVVPNDPVYTRCDDDPLWQRAVFRADGSRRILKRQSNGDCQFLGAQGCCLPTEVRPLVCRLFPYDFNESGILPELTGGCPTHLLHPGETLLVALDMNRTAADRWHQQLYSEIKREPHFQETQQQSTISASSPRYDA